MYTIEKAPYFAVNFSLIGYDGDQTYMTEKDFENGRMNLLDEILSLEEAEKNQKEAKYPKTSAFNDSSFEFANIEEIKLNLEQIGNLNLIKAFQDSNILLLGMSQQFFKNNLKRLGKAKIAINNTHKYACEKFVYHHQNDILKFLLQEGFKLLTKKGRYMRTLLVCNSDEINHYLSKSYEVY